MREERELWPFSQLSEREKVKVKMGWGLKE